MKKLVNCIAGLFGAVLLICFCLGATGGKIELNKHNHTYAPFAIGAVRIENGFGEIKHPKIKWNSIILYSPYSKEADTPFGEKLICSVNSGAIRICSNNPNEVSIYTFAIYDGDARGVIYPEER